MGKRKHECCLSESIKFLPTKTMQLSIAWLRRSLLYLLLSPTPGIVYLTASPLVEKEAMNTSCPAPVCSRLCRQRLASLFSAGVRMVGVEEKHQCCWCRTAPVCTTSRDGRGYVLCYDALSHVISKRSTETDAFVHLPARFHGTHYIVFLSKYDVLKNM